MQEITVGRSGLLTESRSHTHDNWELVLNLEGTGESTVGRVTVPITAGTVILIPPRTPHSKSVPSGFRDAFIHFASLALPQSQEILCFEDKDHHVEQLLGMIHAVYYKKEGCYREISEHLTEALAVLVVDRLGRSGRDSRVSYLANLAVEHFNDPDFSISDAMEKGGYCVDHLRRLFHAAYGESPLEYLTTLRIRYAKKLMRENASLHYTVAEIATMSGFSDISYFSRVFKKRTGVSPREYMRSVSEKPQGRISNGAEIF